MNFFDLGVRFVVGFCPGGCMQLLIACLVLAAFAGQEQEIDEVTGKINAVISEAFEKGFDLFPAKLPVLTKLSPSQVRCGDYIIREGAELYFQLAFVDKDRKPVFRTFAVRPRVVTVVLDKKAQGPRFRMLGKDGVVKELILTMSPQHYEEGRYCLL
ncbi:MAG: hypothetical protein JNN11_03745 [Candidatus Doudnabacteria bacterium]|nr:hypothetical protein [Candidatus Doudnabacteria bacterium]